MRVFLVDDSLSVRNRLALSVQQAGSELCGEASTESDAIRSILISDPDVVVLDLQLKEGNGLNVMSAVKKERATVGFIVLTNHADAQIRNRCIHAGADYFFEKVREYPKFEELLQQNEIVSQAISSK